MAVIATAEVRVIADTSRFLSNLRRQLRGAFGNVGAQSAQQFTREFNRNLGDDLTQALRRAAQRATGPMQRAGRAAGNAFNDGFQGSLRDVAASILGDITNRIEAARPEARQASGRLAQSLADGLRQARPALITAVEDVLSGIDTRIDAARGTAREGGGRLMSEFAQGIRRGQAQIRAEAAAAARVAGDGLLTAFRRRLATGVGRAFLQFGRNLRTGLVGIATTVGGNFGTAFQNSLVNRATGIGTAFLNLIRRAMGREVVSEAEAAGGRAGNAFSRGLSRALRGLTAGLRGLGQALSSISLRPLIGLAGLLRDASTEMISMAAQALLLVALLESLSGLLFALPAALNVLAAGITTAAVAFQGFGSAIGASFDDLDAFNDAIEDLAPAAQDVAREFRAIAPALTEIRLDTQNALFSQLDRTIAAVADTLLGPLQQGMTAAASALGFLVAEIGEFFAQGESAQTLTATFRTLTVIFEALATSAQPFLEGMRTLVDEFLPRIAEAAGPLSELGAQFRDWAEAVTESGAAMEAFDFAVEVFQNLLGIVADLGGIFQAMFSAAELAGVDALGAIGAALETIRTAFESFEGQLSLASAFAAIGDTINALAPVFATLIQQLGLVLPIVADIAEALGPSLSVVIEGLGQALLALGPGVVEVFAGIAAAAEAIAPALAPLGEAIGQILSAIAPILPVIGELIAIVVEFGAQLLSVLATAIAPIVEALAGALAPILPQLADLFTRLVEALAPVIEALGAGLAGVIATLLPPILELVVALADALMPIIEALLPVLTPLIEIFFQLVEVIGALLVPVISLLLPIIEALSPLFEVLATFLTPLLELFSAILEPVTILITLLAELLTPVIEFLAEIIGGIIEVALVPLTASFEFLGQILADHVIPWFEEASAILEIFWHFYIEPLIERIRELADTARDRFDAFREAVSSAVDGAVSAVESVIGWFEDLGSDIGSVVSDIDGFLGDMGDTFQSVFDGIVDAVSGAADTVSGIIESIIGAVQSAIDTVSNLGDIDLNPFADGGIVNRPTAALIGEAGKEVVIPLTRPQRAVELAQQSGLLDLLASHGAIGGGGAPTGPPVEMHVHSGVADPEQVARRAVRLIERRQAGRGLERVS